MNTADFEYAGFWIRVWASLIDSALLMLLVVPLMLMVYGTAYFDADSALIRGPADLLISWLLPALAVVLFWLLRRATPGKMAIAATVVDAGTGAALTPQQALLRYLGYFVSTLPFGLGLIWVAFDPRKQGWHDKLAGSVVIRRRRRGDPQAAARTGTGKFRHSLAALAAPVVSASPSGAGYGTATTTRRRR